MSCANWRTQLKRLIRRSGQEPWGMPFQNLRSSREVELSEVFPWFTVCSWIGHSRAVAAEHYMSVPAEHIARAIAGESGSIGRGKPAQNPAQQVQAEPRRTSQGQGGEGDETAFCGQKQRGATPCGCTESHPIPPRGVEQTPLTPQKHRFRKLPVQKAVHLMHKTVHRPVLPMLN